MTHLQQNREFRRTLLNTCILQSNRDACTCT